MATADEQVVIAGQRTVAVSIADGDFIYSGGTTDVQCIVNDNGVAQRAIKVALIGPGGAAKPKYVDTLPEVGEEGVLYMVNSGVTRDGYAIFQMFSWHNNAWVAIGAFDVGIDPTGLVYKNELATLAYTPNNLVAGDNVTLTVQQPQQQGIDSHCVACWHFNTDFNDVVDSIPFTSNDGELSNSGPVAAKFGVGCCYVLNSNDSNIDMLAENEDAVAKINASKKVTIDFWFYDGWSGYEGPHFSIGFNALGSNYADLITVYRNGYNDGSIIMYGNGTGQLTYNFGMPTNTWRHLAIQRDEASSTPVMNVFLDGTKVLETNSLTPMDSTKLLLADCSYHNLWDELRISDTVRYTSTFTPETDAYDVIEDSVVVKQINANVPYATSSVVGGFKQSFDATTGTWTVTTESI